MGPDTLEPLHIMHIKDLREKNEELRADNEARQDFMLKDAAEILRLRIEVERAQGAVERLSQLLKIQDTELDRDLGVIRHSLVRADRAEAQVKKMREVVVDLLGYCHVPKIVEAARAALEEKS